MAAIQVVDAINDGRTFQDFDRDSLPADLTFSVMVMPTYDPIKRLVPAMFGCRHCGTAWMIASPAPFGTCGTCGGQHEILAI